MNNLNLGKCPTCGENLVYNTSFRYYLCSNSIQDQNSLVYTCPFSITEEDYDSYVNQPRDNEYHENTTDENLAYLRSL